MARQWQYIPDRISAFALVCCPFARTRWANYTRMIAMSDARWRIRVNGTGRFASDGAGFPVPLVKWRVLAPNQCPQRLRVGGPRGDALAPKLSSLMIPARRLGGRDQHLGHRRTVPGAGTGGTQSVASDFSRKTFDCELSGTTTAVSAKPLTVRLG